MPVSMLCRQAAKVVRQKWSTEACHAWEFLCLAPRGSLPFTHRAHLSHHAAGQKLLFHRNVATVLPLPKSVLTHAELVISAGIMVNERTDKTEGISWFIKVAGFPLYASHSTRNLIFQLVLKFLTCMVHFALRHVLLTGSRPCSFPCNDSQFCGCLHSREIC